MYADRHDPLSTPGGEPVSMDTIMESFQKVLDGLDAAREDLHRSDPWGLGSGNTETRRRPQYAPTPPPVVEAPADPAGPSAAAAAYFGAPPAAAPYGPQAGADFEDLVFFRRDSAQDAGYASDGVPSPTVVEPLWARSERPEYPPLPAQPEPGAPEAVDAWPGYTDAPATSGWFDRGDRGAGAAMPDIAVSPAHAWPEEIQVTPTGPAEGDSRRSGGRRRTRPALRRGHLAGVCGAGAVGGLIVASSLMADSGMAPSQYTPSVQPENTQPGSADAPGPDAAPGPEAAPPRGGVGGPVEEGMEGQGLQRSVPVPRLHRGDAAQDHPTVEVRITAARFQGPVGGALSGINGM
ncbi:hypothetical protein AB0M39_30670 [Streptomyces sp. NPDC051907]|uniref:hypothetical protein n=1 Tax=Streptomyces sp. NPDC051907 TaxID=3155284 RepID=UPI003432BB39